MTTVIEKLIDRPEDLLGVKIPVIKLQEQWICGSVETTFIGCCLHYSYLKGYEMSLHNDDEPGDKLLKIKIYLGEEWEFFYLRSLNKATTIPQLEVMAGDLVEKINRWIDRRS